MWFVYILLCADNTFYTGVTTDIERRLRQHNGEIVGGAKYTRVRQPVQIIYHNTFESRSDACKEESRIKKLNRLEKEKLVNFKI